MVLHHNIDMFTKELAKQDDMGLQATKKLAKTVMLGKNKERKKNGKPITIEKKEKKESD